MRSIWVTFPKFRYYRVIDPVNVRSTVKWRRTKPYIEGSCFYKRIPWCYSNTVYS